MRDNDLRERVDSIRLEEQWSDILNDPLSDKLTPVGFDEGRLKLKAKNPSWSQEASLKKETIRETINDYFDRDLVDDIHVTN